MTILTDSIPPLVRQDAQGRRNGLAADLRAFTDRAGSLDVTAIQSFPAVLRRLAALLSEHIPSGTDRLVAAPGDTPLVTALALHTGIPFALIDNTNVTMGELHTAEKVIVVQVATTDAAELLKRQVEDHGAYVLSVLTAISSPAGPTHGPSSGSFLNSLHPGLNEGVMMADSSEKLAGNSMSRSTVADRTQSPSIHRPVLFDEAGRRLAEQIAGQGAEVVVIWEGMESAVLGHVVARQLGADLVCAYAVQGSLGLSAGIYPGAKVALVDIDWATDPGLEPLLKLLETRNAEIVGIGSVLQAVLPAAAAGIRVCGPGWTDSRLPEENNHGA